MTMYALNITKGMILNMGLFGPSKKDIKIHMLERENKRLKKLCEEKDLYFKEMISDGLRHKSKLASKHMKDLKDYKNGKY